jgi:hypothetical protein
MQLSKLAESSEDSWAISDKSLVYQTDKRMYMNNVKFDIEPRNFIRKIHFNRISGATTVRFMDQEGTKTSFSSSKIASGEKNFILEPHTKLEVEFLPGALVN